MDLGAPHGNAVGHVPGQQRPDLVVPRPRAAEAVPPGWRGGRGRVSRSILGRHSPPCRLHGQAGPAAPGSGKGAVTPWAWEGEDTGGERAACQPPAPPVGWRQPWCAPSRRDPPAVPPPVCAFVERNRAVTPCRQRHLRLLSRAADRSRSVWGTASWSSVAGQTLSIVNDILIGLILPGGFDPLLQDATVYAGTWLFVLGSALMLVQPRRSRITPAGAPAAHRPGTSAPEDSRRLLTRRADRAGDRTSCGAQA
ncbi:YrhK family protein [Kocuria rhizophila]|nr:YrhK family protein [Kocuria rhizophila]